MPEPLNVFMSYSGRDSAAIARMLRGFLNRVFGTNIGVYSFSEKRHSGADWYAELWNELKEADCFIGLVDHDFLRSGWCFFELGIFLAHREIETTLRRSPMRLFGLHPDDKEQTEPSTPLKRWEINAINEDTIDETLQFLQQGCFEKGANPDIGGRIDQVAQLVADIGVYLDGRQRDEETNRDAFYSDIRRYWLSSARNHYLTADARLRFNSFLGGFRNPELARQLDETIRYYEECFALADGSRGWNGIWAEVAKSIIDGARAQIREASIQRIVLYDNYYIKRFWNKHIMSKVEKSIWTTNLPGTHGRRPNKAFLRTQKAAIKRGATVTRVFVFRPGDTADMRELKRVIPQQKKAGVDIWVISEEKFDEALNEAPDRQPYRDFMIIDERFVYITDVDDDTHFISRIRLDAEKRVLTVAQEAQNEVMHSAKEIDEDNLDSWWDEF